MGFFDINQEIINNKDKSFNKKIMLHKEIIIIRSVNILQKIIYILNNLIYSQIIEGPYIKGK